MQRYRNRTISEADADQLHPGLRKLAKRLNWKVVPEVDPEDPSRITLADLAQGSGMDTVQAEPSHPGTIDAEFDDDDDDGDDDDDDDDERDGLLVIKG